MAGIKFDNDDYDDGEDDEVIYDDEDERTFSHKRYS